MSLPTLRTLDNYLIVALLEAEYWGTNVMDPDYNTDQDPLYMLLLKFDDQDEMSRELINSYNMQEAINRALDRTSGQGGEYEIASNLWCIIAADLEQRIEACDGSYA